MFTKHVSAVVLAVGIAGCTNTHAVYDGPKDALASEIAVCKGSWGTYIHEVDGRHVQSSNITMDNLGGNSITAAPGNHLFMVWIHTDNPALTAVPGPLIAVNIAAGLKDNRHTFWFNCEKGHTYEFSPRNLFTSALKVTDQNTGKSLDVE